MISELCEALLAAHRRHGIDISQDLLPGLPREAIEAETAWFPSRLPDDLIALYGWRNGQPEDAWNSQNVLWFRDMQFTSLQRARDEYVSMMDSYGLDNDPASEGIDLRMCFPFASFNGGWYVVPCEGPRLDSRFPFPVVSVFQGISIYFDSIETMLRTCVDWRVASSWSGDDWELPEHLEMEIWRRYNQGRR